MAGICDEYYKTSGFVIIRHLSCIATDKCQSLSVYLKAFSRFTWKWCVYYSCIQLCYPFSLHNIL